MSDGQDAVARLDALLTPLGHELLDRLKREDVTPETTLRVATLLRAEYPADLVRDALAQHELRDRARSKFTRAADMFFTRAGLEQGSSEPVASYRAGRYHGAERVADLCCGIGGDLVALAASHQLLAVDRDPLHARMARANAGVYGVAGHVTVATADVRDADLTGVPGVFVDPARRTGQRRLRAGDSEPPLGWCLALAGRIPAVGIKAAPGLPHELAPPGWELEFIATGRELKEAVLWSPPLATVTRRATILPGPHTLTRAPGGAGLPGGAGPDTEVPVLPPGRFLYDPSPAVTRAGLVQDLALLINAWKIDDQIAFLSSDAPAQTPFARLLEVIDSAPWDQKRLPARLRALDVGAADIRRRGLAGDVDRLHRQLKLSGSRRVTLVMTRVSNHPWALVCQEPRDLLSCAAPVRIRTNLDTKCTQCKIGEMIMKFRWAASLGGGEFRWAASFGGVG
ncbi:MAG: class I SAM-dependent methyltransferase [Streptosporangiaceae bacterium]